MLVTHIFKATGLSGAEGHLIALAAGLHAEGIESRWIVLVDRKQPPTALFEAAQARGIPFDIVPIAHDLDLTVLPKVASLLKMARAQIVHTHMIHGDLYGTLAARLVGIPIVQSRHNDDRFRRVWILRGLMNLLSSQARAVVAISESLAAFTRDVEGVPASKITRIYYGIDPAELISRAKAGTLRAELGLDTRTPLVAAVGRLTAQKGFQFLIEAFARVLKSQPDARLVIAGDGELRSALEAQADALGISQAIRFLGWRNDVPSLMADMDVLAVPSLWEGFGLVTLEAMASSKPIIAGRVSALPEIVVHGETGLLVPPGDSAALADALTLLLNDADRARKMGERGRARLDKEFTVDRMARQHTEVYRSLMADSR